MSDLLKATMGFKGERGYSAYDVAVQNGFEGTVQDWLATLGTAQHFDRTVTKINVTSNQSVFNMPSDLTSSSIVDVYVNGIRKTEDSYIINVTGKTITFTTQLVSGNVLEIYLTKMSTSELPIVTTIDESSTDDTVASARSVYTKTSTIENNLATTNSNLANTNIEVANKVAKGDIAVITGRIDNIPAGETAYQNINYPAGFDKNNSLIISKMVSSNNSYYDAVKDEMTANGFPTITMMSLTDSVMVIWLKNTNLTQTRNGYYKITLMKI